VEGSVILEWSQAGGGEQRRGLQMIESLAGDARSLNGEWELIVCGAPEALGPRRSAAIRAAAGSDDEGFALKILEAPAAVTSTLASFYFALKNYGASVAQGDLLVFADSDLRAESGWLRAMVDTFANPDVHVAAGTVYPQCGNWYEDAVAMFWFFEPRCDRSGVRRTARFFANSVAFRREIFERHPFPKLAGTNRGACALLARELQRDGIPIWVNDAARAAHPAPEPVCGFLMRGLSHGRDNYVAYGPARTLARFAAGVGQSFVRPLRRFAKLAVPVYEVPAGIAVGLAYWSLHLLGLCAAALIPGLARRRITA
jgi:hypothetical protein